MFLSPSLVVSGVVHDCILTYFQTKQKHNYMLDTTLMSMGGLILGNYLSPCAYVIACGWYCYIGSSLFDVQPAVRISREMLSFYALKLFTN